MKPEFFKQAQDLVSNVNEKTIDEKRDVVIVLVAKSTEKPSLEAKDSYEAEGTAAFAGSVKDIANLLVSIFEDEQHKHFAKAVFTAVNQYREEHATCRHPHPDEDVPKMFERLKKRSVQLSTLEELLLKIKKSME